MFKAAVRTVAAGATVVGLAAEFIRFSWQKSTAATVQ